MSEKIQKQLLELVTDDYQQIVDMCADNQYGLPLPNRSIKHAGILTRAIFRNAVDRVEIYSGSLDEMFLNQVEDSIKETMDEKPDLQVDIILAHTSKLNETASRLKDEFGERMQFYKAKTGYNKLQHFSVSGNMFRLEEVHDTNQNFKKDPAVKAKANFNAPEGAKFLRGQFSDAKGDLLAS